MILFSNTREILIVFLLIDRISKHLQQTLGPGNSTKFLQKYASKGDLVKRYLICSEFQKLYRYPDQGFAALDFIGKGYVTIEDVMKHPLLYKLPLTRSELQQFLS